MGHITSKNFNNLQKRLDDAAQGAPAHEALYKILELLFTEEEAKLTSILPLNFFDVKDAAKLWDLSEKESLKILNGLADKGILLDLEKGKNRKFILAPTMAGFFEFALMRTDGKFDCEALSDLFYNYINQEETFVRRIFRKDETIDRVFLHEDQMPTDGTVILDYEKASHIIKTATSISVGRCYCRHKMEHQGKACDNPQDVCLTFNQSAESLIKHKIAKKITKKEAFKILDKCMNLGLVQIGDRVQNDVNWICNCCSCCCEALLSYKHLGFSYNLTSNFVSENNYDKCTACGLCATKCPVNAIEIVTEGNKKYAKINEQGCIGCGVCVRYCPSKSLEMKRVKNPKLVPKDSFERIISMAIDTGTIQNYLFDNYTLLSHKILRNFLGVLISLPLSKQILASKQLKSRFLNQLIKTKYYSAFDSIYNKGKKVDYRHTEF